MLYKGSTWIPVIYVVRYCPQFIQAEENLSSYNQSLYGQHHIVMKVLTAMRQLTRYSTYLPITLHSRVTSSKWNWAVFNGPERHNTCSSKYQSLATPERNCVHITESKLYYTLYLLQSATAIL